MIRSKKSIVFILILVILSVSLFCVSSQNAFNLNLEIPETYESLKPGQDIWFTLKVFNLAYSERVDITLKYFLIDPNGLKIISKSDTVAIETQANFVRKFKIPLESISGNYIIRAELFYNNNLESISSNSINIKIEEEQKDNFKLFIIAGTVIALIMIVLILLNLKNTFSRIRLRMKINSIVRKRNLNS